MRERKDPYEFTAPESGYQESDICNDPDLKELQKEYFLKFSDGRYGCLRIDLDLADPRNSIIALLAANPSTGSRNLEGLPWK